MVVVASVVAVVVVAVAVAPVAMAPLVVAPAIPVAPVAYIILHKILLGTLSNSLLNIEFLIAFPI